MFWKIFALYATTAISTWLIFEHVRTINLMYILIRIHIPLKQNYYITGISLAIYLWMYLYRHFMASIHWIASHVLHRTHVKKKKRNNNSPLIMLPDSSPNPYVLHEIASLPPSNMCTYRWLQQILRILSFETCLVDHYNL